MSDSWTSVTKKINKVKVEKPAESRKFQIAKNRFIQDIPESSTEDLPLIADTDIKSTEKSGSSTYDSSRHDNYGTVNFKSGLSLFKPESRLTKSAKKGFVLNDNAEVIAKLQALFDETQNAPELYVERLIPTISQYFDKSSDLNFKGIPWVVRINIFEDLEAIKRSLNICKSNGIPCNTSKVVGNKKVPEKSEQIAERIYSWTKMGPQTRELIIQSLSNVASRTTNLTPVYNLANELYAEVAAHSSESIVGRSTAFFVLYALCKAWPALSEQLVQNIPASDELRFFILSFHPYLPGQLTLRNYFSSFDVNYISIASVNFLYALSTKHNFGCGQFIVILVLLMNHPTQKKLHAIANKLYTNLLENNSVEDDKASFHSIMFFFDKKDLSTHSEATLNELRDFVIYALTTYRKELDDTIRSTSATSLARLATIIPSLSEKQLKKISPLAPTFADLSRSYKNKNKDLSKYLAHVAQLLHEYRSVATFNKCLGKTVSLALKGVSAALALCIVYRVVMDKE